MPVFDGALFWWLQESHHFGSPTYHCKGRLQLHQELIWRLRIVPGHLKQPDSPGKRLNPKRSGCGCGSKSNNQGTAEFSSYVHFPGLNFGYLPLPCVLFSGMGTLCLHKLFALHVADVSCKLDAQSQDSETFIATPGLPARTRRRQRMRSVSCPNLHSRHQKKLSEYIV